MAIHAKISPLLAQTIGRLAQAPSEAARDALAAHAAGSERAGQLPISIRLPREAPVPGESWPGYRERVAHRLQALRDKLQGAMGVDSDPLIAATALASSASIAQIERISEEEEVEVLDLDPLVELHAMDDVADDVGLPGFRSSRPGVEGQDVRVAVLDSGIDVRHPFLAVDASTDTCGESVEIPGRHGTHCAGSIASQDPIFAGVAPAATLLNVKVLRADGTGRETFIARGVDAALDLEADVLSMSLGFNHMPTWAPNGHGWTCTDGRCVLCAAVDTAVEFGRVVVAAAGNEADTAAELRRFGFGSEFDTELGCPGQARGAITVGAISKRLFLPASFSSRGPTSYGAAKPDLVAAGVNITSTVPVPRDANGNPDPNPPRSLLFARLSGTSMATPTVAGAVALLIQMERAAQRDWTPESIRDRLLRDAVTPLPGSANAIGNGRLDLSRL